MEYIGAHIFFLDLIMKLTVLFLSVVYNIRCLLLTVSSRL
jgi:hypothetical protein